MLAYYRLLHLELWSNSNSLHKQANATEMGRIVFATQGYNLACYTHNMSIRQLSVYIYL